MKHISILFCFVFLLTLHASRITRASTHSYILSRLVGYASKLDLPSCSAHPKKEPRREGKKQWLA